MTAEQLPARLEEHTAIGRHRVTEQPSEAQLAVLL